MVPVSPLIRCHLTSIPLSLPLNLIESYNHDLSDLLRLGLFGRIGGLRLKTNDVGPQALDFQLKGDYKWEDFNDLICSPPTESLAALVPQTADIPAQIINWFKIASKQSWNLDGRVWIDQ